MPRTFYSGPSVTAKGGHPTEMFSFLPGLAEQLTRQVETPEAARAAIAELDRERVDIVKLVLEHLTETWRHIVDVRFRVNGRDTRPRARLRL